MKKNKTLKYLLIAVGVLLLFSIIGKKAGWFGKGEMTKVAVEKVSRRDITEIVSASGKVQPEVELKLSADVSGEIVELHVKEGEHVEKGMLLAKIKPDAYISQLDRMNAALNTSKADYSSQKSRKSQAESQFTKAESTFNRTKKLFDQGAVSSSDFETAKSAYEVAKAEVDAAQQAILASEFNMKSAEASLKESQDNLLKTSIFAPVSGTISKLNKEQGERVVGTNMMEGTEILRIADLNEMEVSVDVNESDIVRVHKNDTALIEVDAYLNRKFKGLVTEIANTASTMGMNTDQVTNFTVKIRILHESYQDLMTKLQSNESPFRPGMSATVDIQTKTERNVLSVPVQSVTTRDTAVENKDRKKADTKGEHKEKHNDEAKLLECVFVADSGKVKLQLVKTGVQDNNYIEILTGLDTSFSVVSGPYSAVSKKLKAGDKVEVVDKDKLFEKEEK